MLNEEEGRRIVRGEETNSERTEGGIELGEAQRGAEEASPKKARKVSLREGVTNLATTLPGVEDVEDEEEVDEGVKVAPRDATGERRGMGRARFFEGRSEGEALLSKKEKKRREEIEGKQKSMANIKSAGRGMRIRKTYICKLSLFGRTRLHSHLVLSILRLLPHRECIILRRTSSRPCCR